MLRELYGSDTRSAPVARSMRRDRQGKSQELGSIAQPTPPESRVAFEVLRFAYDDPIEKEITGLCERLLG